MLTLLSYLKDNNIRISDLGNICLNDVIDMFISSGKIMNYKYEYKYEYYVSPEICTQLSKIYPKNKNITILTSLIKFYDHDELKKESIYIISTKKARESFFNDIMDEIGLTYESMYEEYERNANKVYDKYLIKSGDINVHEIGKILSKYNGSYLGRDFNGAVYAGISNMDAYIKLKNKEAYLYLSFIDTVGAEYDI